MIQYIEIKTSSTIEQISNKIRRQTINSNDSEYVKKIMNDVKKNKDKALLKYSLKFDKVKFTKSELKVKNKEIREAYLVIDPKIVKELKNLKRTIEKTENMIMKSYSDSVKGVKINNGQSFIKYNITLCFLRKYVLFQKYHVHESQQIVF